VLFLDELTEFRRNADEAFYQPRKTRAMLAALMSVPPTRPARVRQRRLALGRLSQGSGGGSRVAAESRSAGLGVRRSALNDLLHRSPHRFFVGYPRHAEDDRPCRHDKFVEGEVFDPDERVVLLE